MKLQDKHVDWLDRLEFGKWYHVYNLPSLPKGMTMGTINSLEKMGIVRLAWVCYGKDLTDEDVSRGYLNVPVKTQKVEWSFEYIKKVVNDYRTRDYEVESLRQKIAGLQAQIDALTQTTTTDEFRGRTEEG